MRRILVTGGAGFIGSAFVRHWLAAHPGDRLVNLDALTYAGNLENLRSVESAAGYRFVHGDIGDEALVEELFATERIDTVVNFAAESHVDRSILGPAAFIRTNVMGTFTLLEAARRAWDGGRDGARFLHVSTDEVYGSLGFDDPPFSEANPYAPNSPYAASKASADHLVRAWFHTYGLPTLTTNCSNNYGPYQFPEKLIPLVTLNALESRPIPVYGEGTNVRDWLHVADHCEAIDAVLQRGRPGETYNIGGGSERRNIEVVQQICDRVDEVQPGGPRRRELITFVKDRPGHDLRYAIDATRMASELGWTPRYTFEAGLRQTVDWYLQNLGWCERIRDGAYRDYYRSQYGDGE